MNRIGAVVLLALALADCTRASTTMLSPDTAVISGRGTAFDTSGGVAKATLNEAATQTLARGYRYFVVTNAQDASRTGVFVSPGHSTSYTTGSVYASGNYATGSATTQTYTTPSTATPFVKPGVEATIKMYRQGEIDPKAPGVWDAQAVLATK